MINNPFPPHRKKLTFQPKKQRNEAPALASAPFSSFDDQDSNLDSFSTDPDSYLQPAISSSSSPDQSTSDATALGNQTPIFNSPTASSIDPPPLFDDHHEKPQPDTDTSNNPTAVPSAIQDHQEAIKRLNDFTGGKSPYFLQNGDPMQWMDTVRGPKPLSITNPEEKQKAFDWLNQRAQLHDEVQRLAPAAAFERQHAEESPEATRLKRLMPDTINSVTGKYLNRIPQPAPVPDAQKKVDDDLPFIPIIQLGNPPWDPTYDDPKARPSHDIRVKNAYDLWVDGIDYVGDTRGAARGLLNDKQQADVEEELRKQNAPLTGRQKALALTELAGDGIINMLLAAAGGEYGADAVELWGSPFHAREKLGWSSPMTEDDLRRMVGATQDLAFAAGAHRNPTRQADFANEMAEQRFGSPQVLRNGGGTYPQITRDGRRGTVRVILTKAMLGTGRDTAKKINPPGFRELEGLVRAHLHAANHGGPGDFQENYIAVPHETTNMQMLKYENAITKYVRTTGEPVYLELTPLYENGNNISTGVHMYAGSLHTGKTLQANGKFINATVPVPQK